MSAKEHKMDKSDSHHPAAQRFSGNINIDTTETEVIGVSVRQNPMIKDQYIKNLIKANRTLNSENRRLVKLLHQYQEIIRIGTNNWQGL